jgi:hypothetical protein
MIPINPYTWHPLDKEKAEERAFKEKSKGM